MKNFLFLLAGLLCTSLAFSQKKAVTDTGEEVILYEDGTWKYQNVEDALSNSIPTNPNAFTKGDEATFLLRSKKARFGFWLDPGKWTFKNANNNTEAEYALKYKKGDLYGLIIIEKLEIPLETLRTIALQNGKSASPDIQIVKEEYRTVNGKKVLFLKMDGTIQGIKFSYYGYYFSSEKGTVQFLTYTTQNMMEEYIPACEELLNGFVLLDD